MTYSVNSQEGNAMPSAIHETGVIEPGVCYTPEKFKAITGLTKWSYWNARNNGFRVRKSGKKVFILGDDWIEYLRRDDKDNAAPASSA